MTEQIKVSEVSSILRQQLEGIHTSIKLEEVGTVLQVSDGVARIYGLDNAEANELLQFDNGMEAIVMNLEEDNVGAVLLGRPNQGGRHRKTHGPYRLYRCQRGDDRACDRSVGKPDRRERRDPWRDLRDAA